MGTAASVAPATKHPVLNGTPVRLPPSPAKAAEASDVSREVAGAKFSAEQCSCSLEVSWSPKTAGGASSSEAEVNPISFQKNKYSRSESLKKTLTLAPSYGGMVDEPQGEEEEGELKKASAVAQAIAESAESCEDPDMIKKVALREGPPQGSIVLHAKKFSAGWDLINRHFELGDANQLVFEAAALKSGLQKVSRALEQVLFDETLWVSPTGVSGKDGRDTGNWRQPGAHGPYRSWGHMADGSIPGVEVNYQERREEILAELRNVQDGAATAMMEHVHHLVEKMYGFVVGTSKIQDAIPNNIPEDGEVVQPLPEDIMRAGAGELINISDLSEETREMLQKTADVLCDTTTTYTNERGEEKLCWKEQSAAIPGVAISDFAFISRLTSQFNEENITSPLLYLLAASIPVYPAFVKMVKSTLSNFGELKVAMLKGYGRSAVKTAPDGDYSGFATPYSQHLKDILRCTLVVDTAEEMHAAYEAWAAAPGQEIVVCKNRLEEPTHDVLMISRLEESRMLCEIQLHFRSLVSLKAFAHAAYSVSRTDASNNSCYGLISLYDVTWLGQLDLKDADKSVATRCTLVID